MEYYVHPSAVVDDGAKIGPGTRIWHFSHVMSGATLGSGCNLGQNVFIASGVTIGANVKIQNNVSVYAGVILEDDVFCGPSCVFTNVTNPRSEIIRRDQYAITRVRRGCSLGANSTIVCGTTLGRYALVGAGAVVTRGEYPDYALLIGVPARRAGWVSRHGHVISEREGIMRCPESGWRYAYTSDERDALRCLDKPEDEAILP